MDHGLQGRTAVVTGAGPGMGLAAARMLLDEGARVLAGDPGERRQPGLGRHPDDRHHDEAARGGAEEVAAAVLFLCSCQAGFIAGTNMRIDGGSVAVV